MDNSTRSGTTGHEEPVCDDCRRPIRGMARVRDVMGDLVLYHIRCTADPFGVGRAPAAILSFSFP